MITRRSTLLGLALGLVGGCRSAREESPESTAPEPEALRNRLAGTPTLLYHAAADSPVPWQPWGPSALERARERSRLLFVIVGRASDADSLELLERIDRDPTLVAALSREVVPVLADGDVAREAVALADALAIRRDQSPELPFLIVVSPEGAPTSGLGLDPATRPPLEERLATALQVAGQLWREDPDYVRRDSGAKLDFHRESLPVPEAADPAARDAVPRQLLRQLTNLHDEDLGRLDVEGDHFPAGILDALASASLDPSLPAALRDETARTCREFTHHLLASAMIDPLDGRIHARRRARSWNLPRFRPDAAGQARAIRCLARLESLVGLESATAVARRALDLTSTRFTTEDGRIAISEPPRASANEEAWLWTVDQLREALDEREFDLWSQRAEIDPLGNLDPATGAFRLNSLRAARSLDELAAASGRPAAEVERDLESGRRKLLATRQRRHPATPPPTHPTAAPSYRMVSARAAVFIATGEDEQRQRAIELAIRCNESFASGPFLLEVAGAESDPSGEARAHTHAVAIQALLDLAAVTLDERWHLEAIDLASLLAEHFIDTLGRLLEVRHGARLVPAPLPDAAAPDGDPTHALMRLNLARFEALALPTPPPLAAFAASLPDASIPPALHPLTISALVHPHACHRLRFGPELAPAARERVARLPLERVERRVRPDLGASVELTGPEGSSTVLSSPDEIERALRGLAAPRVDHS